MLEKILKDMFVPEEILNNISDDDKQLIFLEIRKEQIRRYNTWQNSNRSSEEFHHKPNVRGKNIKFADDTDLVSVFGERPNDRPIEDILNEETLRRAQQEAERVVLQELGSRSPEKDFTECPRPMENPVSEVPNSSSNNIVEIPQISGPVDQGEPDSPSKPVIKRRDKPSGQKLEDMMKRKSTEIYHNLLSQQSFLEETAIKENEQLTPIWEKAAEQAKIDDEQRRKKAVEARKFYANIKKTSQDFSGSVDLVDQIPATSPKTKSSQFQFFLKAIKNYQLSNKTNLERTDIKSWFLQNEWNKKRIVDHVTDKVPNWFHGMISREITESLLSPMKIGSFLVRVSDKCLGYELSYKAKRKIKHMLIQSKTDCAQYEFLGPPNVTVFKRLQDMITHFQAHFIDEGSRDILTTACGQVPGSVVDYISLIQPDSSQDDSKSIRKCSV